MAYVDIDATETVVVRRTLVTGQRLFGNWQKTLLMELLMIQYIEHADGVSKWIGSVLTYGCSLGVHLLSKTV